MCGESTVTVMAELYVPLFRVSPLPLQARISYLLPSPRTIVGMLASGLGKYLGLSPEVEVGGKKLRIRLTWDIIGSNVMVTCRAGAWVYKTSNTLRVWLIERHDLLRSKGRKSGKQTKFARKGFPKEVIMDAMIHEYVACDRLIVYAITNLNRFAEGLNTLLEEVGMDKVNPFEVPEMLIKSIRLVDRVGDSESIATVIRASLVKISEIVEEGVLSNMAPIRWIETHDSSMNVIQDMPTTPLIEERRVEIDEEKVQGMVLPLRPKFEKVLYYEHSPYRAKVREGYHIIILDNGDSAVIPRNLLHDERRKRGGRRK